MYASALPVVVVLAALAQEPAKAPVAAPFEKELKYQQQTFKQWWGTELVTKLADLPDVGIVPAERVPYSGHDYPDHAGGTVVAMGKYDRAFHNGRPLATDFERRDVGVHRGSRSGDGTPRGLFAWLATRRTPGWYGHCNGWTAAAIRHAEPQHSVTRNGVVFTPADIKGLLAEIYMYSETEFLGGETDIIHPAILHLTICNWLGLGQHPVGMEVAPGKVVVNYPMFTYRATVEKTSERQADVKLSGRYALNYGRELDKAPALNRVIYFHYTLDLNEQGEIVGGRYHGDSAQIDMLWTPLNPVQGGTKGNERGNPHLDVKEVLAIWRESVPEEIRKKWLNIDPPEEDRVELGEAKPAAGEVTSAPAPSAARASPPTAAATVATPPAARP